MTNPGLDADTEQSTEQEPEGIRLLREAWQNLEAMPPGCRTDVEREARGGARRPRAA